MGQDGAVVTVTAAQQGARITIHVGDAVDVRLAENSAGGYRWTISTIDPARVEVVGQTYESTSPAVGSAGTAVIRLAATKPGVTRVELRQSRPWEPADSAIARFTIDLDIVP